jgi:hypothetical protein
MAEEGRGRAELGDIADITGGAVKGLGTGIRDGGGGSEIKVGVARAERLEFTGATEGGINNVRGVDCRTESRN